MSLGMGGRLPFVENHWIRGKEHFLTWPLQVLSGHWCPLSWSILYCWLLLLWSAFVCSSQTPTTATQQTSYCTFLARESPLWLTSLPLPLMDIFKPVLLGLPSPGRQLSWVESFWEVSFPDASAGTSWLRINLHPICFSSPCHCRQLFQTTIYSQTSPGKNQAFVILQL